MEERLNIIVRKSRNPHLFEAIEELKSPRQTYLNWLSDLIKENEALKKQVLTQNDWTGMRLALRATEKNSHLILELLNNWFLHQSFEPVASHDQKSKHLTKFERDWKDYLTQLQAERSTHKTSQKQSNHLVMPSFDFGEDN